MREDPIADLRRGVVGTFQPLLDPPLPDNFSGHIRLSADGVEIAVIASTKNDPAAGWVHNDGVHDTIAGITEAGTVLVPVTGWRTSTTRGDLVVHVTRWTGTTLLVDADSDEIDGDTVSSTVLLYYGLGSWAGAPSTHEKPIHQDGKIAGWSIELRTQPKQTVQLDDGYQLTLSVEWTIGGDNDRRSATTPLAVRLTSETRRPLEQHLQRLDAVHALLSLAHKKPVTATQGFARLAPESPHQAHMWERTMVDDTTDPGTNAFPVFELYHMNQLDGLAAWVRTCLSHPRAVTPPRPTSDLPSPATRSDAAEHRSSPRIESPRV